MGTPASFARRVLLGCCALLLSACTDAYFPPAVSSPPSYLVVDGFINSQGITTIKLSHTFAIASSAAVPVEARATLYIEEEGGSRYPLREGVSGTYASTALVLNTAKHYRLHINTSTGKEYASNYVPVKTTPPIDAVSWRAENTGLSIYVNTHDPTNATQYYRWETDETWEIRSPYNPAIEYANSTIRNIVVPFPALCWGNAHSTTVQIDKTTALSQDVVANFRLRQLATSSERLNRQYSILVQQYALTSEEYTYWELLRRNTESIGSLFDPQPAQLTGNVHSLGSAADVALGFIGAHSLEERRIFIRRADLPATWPIQTGYEACVPPDTVFLFRPNPPPPRAEILRAAFGGGNFLPIDNLYLPDNTIYGYTAKSRDCIDCRTRGSAVKPSYWP